MIYLDRTVEAQIMALSDMALPHIVEDESEAALSGEPLAGSGFEDETPDPDYQQEEEPEESIQ